MTTKQGAFGILIRSGGWIDRFLRAERAEPYTDDSLNGWAGDAFHAWRFATFDEAQAVANDFAGRFGASDYRFDVIEEEHVPRWFLVWPKWEHEKRAVGSREQL